MPSRERKTRERSISPAENWGDLRCSFAAELFAPRAQIVKTGVGTLTLASGENVFRGNAGVDVREGAFAWTAAQTLGTLKAATGTTLVFAKVGNSIPTLTVNSDVDLDGVNLTFADAATRELVASGYQTLLTVPSDCEISGTPILPNGLKLRQTRTETGVALQVKEKSGFILLVK